MIVARIVIMLVDCSRPVSYCTIPFNFFTTGVWCGYCISRLLNKNMGGDHGHKYEVPDYRIYKVEDCPKLLNVQRALAQKGLKDPWLRNEVWRFQPAFKTEGYRARLTFLRGIQWGFAAFVVTVAIEKVWETLSPSDHSHGHH